jgi:hypothetical protein
MRYFMQLPIVALAGVLLILTSCGDSTASRPNPPLTPSGWQVYHGPHFTMARPSKWTVSALPESNNAKDRPNNLYLFASADGKQYVAVNEQDGWDLTTIQRNFCGAYLPIVTLAGLRMHYSAGSSGTGRSWIFASNRGTVYLLGANDGAGTRTAQAQNDAVLATFNPDSTTSGCK